MRTIETLAVIFSIVSVVLAMRKNIHTWTIGILGILGYMLIFWQEKLYADFILQFIFVAQSIRGYYIWKKDRTTSVTEIENIPLAAIFLSIFVVLGYFFQRYTDNPMPILDSLAASLSILAVYLMSLRKKFAWVTWMAADTIYVIIFFESNLLLSCSLYLLFFFLAWNGYKTWKNEEA